MVRLQVSSTAANPNYPSYRDQRVNLDDETYRNNDFCISKTATIRKTWPYNVYPLEPLFYIVKIEFTRVYIFSLFLIQNIDCGYLLVRAALNFFPMKFSIFAFEKIICILHGQVFVMAVNAQLSSIFVFTTHFFFFFFKILSFFISFRKHVHAIYRNVLEMQ